MLDAAENRGGSTMASSAIAAVKHYIESLARVRIHSYDQACFIKAPAFKCLN